MRVIPSGNRVLVESKPVPNAAGIVLPEGVSGANTHVVVEVGDGRVLDNGTRLPVPFAKGDEIVFHPGGATQLEPQLYGGKQYIVVAVEAIICVVQRETELDGMRGGRNKVVRAPASVLQ